MLIKHEMVFSLSYPRVTVSTPLANQQAFVRI